MTEFATTTLWRERSRATVRAVVSLACVCLRTRVDLIALVVFGIYLLCAGLLAAINHVLAKHGQLATSEPNQFDGWALPIREFESMQSRTGDSWLEAWCDVVASAASSDEL